MKLKQVIKITKALADENRVKIFITIKHEKEISCKELTQRFHLKQPTISHHLKVLQESGLISVRREGQWGYFSINTKVFDEFLIALNGNLK